MRQGLARARRPQVRRTTLLAAILACAGCNSEPATKSIGVRGAYIVLPAVRDRPATLYFVIDAHAAARGKAAPRRLESVTVERAERAEMHETMTMGGMSHMKPLAAVELADGATRFCPGGRHVMLFGLDPRLRAGARTQVRLALDGGVVLGPVADIVALGDDPPAAGLPGCETREN